MTDTKETQALRKHKLKILPEYFMAWQNGLKPFEIRKNDRDFRVGDIVLLQEYESIGDYYTGNELTGIISYMTDFEQKDGYVVFAIALKAQAEKPEPLQVIENDLLKVVNRVPQMIRASINSNYGHRQYVCYDDAKRIIDMCEEEAKAYQQLLDKEKSCRK